ncbi:TetR/AcrR family transcriptional regulator [Acidisoma sp. C75]
MRLLPPDPLKPRKLPRQTRAAVTLGAIFEATIQVLLADGAPRLTTTRVAERAGVSVGTMYQYYPHKQALLYAVLQSHLDHISAEVEAACLAGRGQSAAEMGERLVQAFLNAKSERLDVTKALYLIAEDLDTRSLLAAASERNVAAAAAMLETAPDADYEDLQAVAFALFSAIAGSTRIVFERGVSVTALAALRRELSLMCRAYLNAARVARPGG